MPLNYLSLIITYPYHIIFFSKTFSYHHISPSMLYNNKQKLMNPIVMWFQVFQKYLFIRKTIGTSLATTIKMSCHWWHLHLFELCCKVWLEGAKKGIHDTSLQQLIYHTGFKVTSFKNALSLNVYQKYTQPNYFKNWNITIIEDHIYIFLLPLHIPLFVYIRCQ